MIALELAKFVSLNNETDSDMGARERMLGFTVSFPVEQAPETSAIDSKWKKLSVDDTVESLSCSFILMREKNTNVDINDSCWHMMVKSGCKGICNRNQPGLEEA